MTFSMLKASGSSDVSVSWWITLALASYIGYQWSACIPTKNHSLHLPVIHLSNDITQQILSSDNLNADDLSPIKQLISSFSESDQIAFESQLSIICDSLHEHGMLVLDQHNISSLLISEMYQNAKSFFSESLEYKMTFNDGGFYDPGYVPFGYEQIKSTSTKTSDDDDHPQRSDPMESFFLLAETEEIFAPNISDLPPHFKEVSFYWQQMNVLLKKLHILCSLALDLKANVFEEVMTASPSLQRTHSLKFANYFNLKHNEYGLDLESAPIRYGKHKDWLCFTILKADHAVGGLQIYYEGNEQWIDIEADGMEQDSFIVIAGLLTERMTNGYFKAPSHRVVSMEEQRLSMAFFTGPSLDTFVETMTAEMCPLCHQGIDKEDRVRFDEAVLVNDHLNAITSRTDLRDAETKKFHSL